MKKLLLIVCILFIGLILNSCVSLSQEAYSRNISITTSPYMVQGMSNVYAYTTEIGSAYSIDEIGIIAANNAANYGWSNITILVQYIMPGSTGNYFMGYWVGVRQSIVEVSYWK